MPQPPSAVWDHFVAYMKDNKPFKWSCKYCGHTYTTRNASKKLKHLLSTCTKITEADRESLKDNCKFERDWRL